MSDGKHDREHFEDYREQTAVKHAVLEKYIFAYFHILKRTNKNLVYIDGFAGRGTYTSAETGETVEGSPLRALRKIASNDDLARLVSCRFIEEDPILAKNLQAEMEKFYAEHPHIREPKLAVGEFGVELQKGLDTLAAEGQRLAPTFLFVDPCRVDGTSYTTLERFMQEDSCELLVFFNLDGLRRVIGLEKISDALIDLVGTGERARELVDLVAAKATAPEREAAIVSYYEDLLRTGIGAPFVTSFRFEYEDKKKTSHYLIHATKNPLGFAIMKDVMWSVGRTAEGEGALELQQASITAQPLMFRERAEEIKRHVLDELSGASARRVSYFYETLVQQPDNRLCEKAYREALLELEDDGDIVVLAKDGSATITWNRPTRKGKKTLARDYYVRLATDADRPARPN